MLSLLIMTHEAFDGLSLLTKLKDLAHSEVSFLRSVQRGANWKPPFGGSFGLQVIKNLDYIDYPDSDMEERCGNCC